MYCDLLEYVTEDLPPESKLTFVSYSNPVDIWARAEISDRIRNRALEFKAESGLPLWDCLLFVAGDTESAARTVADAARYINRTENLFGKIAASDLRSRYSELIYFAKFEKRHLALLSTVEGRDGQVRHIPMLDAAASKIRVSAQSIKAACENLFVSGYEVFETKGSYHLVSKILQTEEERRTLLVNSVLLAPLIDARYAAHQLLRSTSSLRIIDDRGAVISKIASC